MRTSLRLTHFIGASIVSASIWLILLALLTVWLAWHLYQTNKEDYTQMLSDGRAALLTLPLAKPSPEAPLGGQGLLGENSDSTFPRQALQTAAPSPLIPGKSQPLKPAPDAALTDETTQGPIPKIGKDGTKPWLFYARPFTRSGSQPMIAIVLTGVGMSKQVSDTALQLPPAITLSVSPYAPSAKQWGNAARALGHEIFIDLPVEDADIAVNDPGPQALLTMNSPSDNLNRLRWVLARAPGALGVIFPQDERFSSSKGNSIFTYRFLNDHGLMVAVTPGGPSDDQNELLTQSALPYAKADIRLDDSLNKDDILHQLAALENVAVRRGQAFGVARATPLTLKILDEWSQSLGNKGIIIAPVSALARMKFS